MKKWMYNALLGIFIGVFVISAGWLAVYFIDGLVQQSRFDALAQLKEDVTPRPAVGMVDNQQEETPTQPQLVEVTDPKTGKALSLLPDFTELYLQNPDLIGWMTIPGTTVDYPVMQTHDDPDYYLYRNFDKENSNRGCLYVWPGYDVAAPSDCITVFGHHMRDGSMFGQLSKFRDADFRAENPYIFFDSLQQLRTYEVMAVFLTTASVGQGFSYHEFIDAGSEKEFDAFVSKVKKLQLYDTGVTAQYGDKLLCLSTCEYSQVNGRLVVVAKQVG